MRFFVSTRLLKPDEVRDFCHREQGFMQGARNPGLLIITQDNYRTGLEWLWVFRDTAGQERSQLRDGGPWKGMPMIEVTED